MGLDISCSSTGLLECFCGLGPPIAFDCVVAFHLACFRVAPTGHEVPSALHPSEVQSIGNVPFGYAMQRIHCIKWLFLAAHTTAAAVPWCPMKSMKREPSLHHLCVAIKYSHQHLQRIGNQGLVSYRHWSIRIILLSTALWEQSLSCWDRQDHKLLDRSLQT